MQTDMINTALKQWSLSKEQFDKKTTTRKNSPEQVKQKFIKSGEVWWCSVGVNLGTEIYGKWELFLRPVLILKKTGKYSFIGIPSSTKGMTRDEETYFWPYEFEEGVDSIFLFSQIRSFDTIRLDERIETLPSTIISLLRKKLFRYLSS